MLKSLNTKLNTLEYKFIQFVCTLFKNILRILSLYLRYMQFRVKIFNFNFCIKRRNNMVIWDVEYEEHK